MAGGQGKGKGRWEAHRHIKLAAGLVRKQLGPSGFGP